MLANWTEMTEMHYSIHDKDMRVIHGGAFTVCRYIGKQSELGHTRGRKTKHKICNALDQSKMHTAPPRRGVGAQSKTEEARLLSAY